MDRYTELVHFDPCPGDPHRATSTPIYQTATFGREAADTEEGYDYTRSGNPTRTALEGQLARLENARHALAYASGMAALAGVARLLRPGDHVVAGSDVYGGTHRLLSRVLEPLGVAIARFPSHDADALAAALRRETKLVLVETPTNPLQQVADIAALSALCRAHGRARLAVDNTVLSPWLQRPLDLGADIVIHSATKHLSGHGDVTAGVVATNHEDVAERLAFHRNAEGNALAPFESWLLLRGTKTLGLRVERAQNAAERVAAFLAARPEIREVYFVGLPDHPGHTLHARQARGPGAVLSFTTGSVETSRRLCEALSLFTIAVSFGSLASTVSMPCAMSHASVPAADRTLPSDLVRLSIGIEGADDLCADLDRALVAATRADEGPATAGASRRAVVGAR